MAEPVTWRSPHEIKRREFMRYAGGTVLTAAAGAGLGLALHDGRDGRQYFEDLANAETVTLPRYDLNNPAGPNRIAVVHGQAASVMVKAAFDTLGGLDKFIVPGDVVLVKPNVAFDRPPEMGASTSPEVLSAVIQQVRECGAKRVLVADNPINQPEGCFEKTGLGPAARAAGGEVILPRPERFTDLAVGRLREGDQVTGEPGEALDRWLVFYEPLRLATKVIGIAPAKDHNLCGASMTMKNWYGLLGGRRNQFHQAIHEVIADFPLMIKPTLVMLDATRILTRNGPTGGSLADVDTTQSQIVVGTDMVAVDAYGWGLLRRRGRPPEYLARAKRRGLGEDDLGLVDKVEFNV